MANNSGGGTIHIVKDRIERNIRDIEEATSKLKDVQRLLPDIYDIEDKMSGVSSTRLGRLLKDMKESQLKDHISACENLVGYINTVVNAYLTGDRSIANTIRSGGK